MWVDELNSIGNTADPDERERYLEVETYIRLVDRRLDELERNVILFKDQRGQTLDKISTQSEWKHQM